MPDRGSVLSADVESVIGSGFSAGSDVSLGDSSSSTSLP